MKPKHQRMVIVTACILMMSAAAAVILVSFRENLIYFYTPTMLQAKQREASFDTSRAFRLGGLVKTGSVEHFPPDILGFIVSDGSVEYKVRYQGLPPTLFRENQGVVMLGTIQSDGTVKASEILAKHDENYMPPEVAKALKDSKHWGGKGSNYPETR